MPMNAAPAISSVRDLLWRLHLDLLRKTNAIREYERFSTVAMNAYVGPQAALYLRNLETKVREAGIPEAAGHPARTAASLP